MSLAKSTTHVSRPLRGRAGEKRVVPKVSLGTLVLAAQLADLVWPILLLARIERVRISPGITAFSPLNFEYYPITHSLFGITALGVLLAVTYFAVTRYRAGAWAVGIRSRWNLPSTLPAFTCISAPR